MLLRLRADGTVVDNGTAGNAVCSIVDQNGGIDEITICVFVTGTDFGKLTSRSSHAILMAFGTGRRVKHRTESCTRIVSAFKLCLIESKCVTGWLRDTV